VSNPAGSHGFPAKIRNSPIGIVAGSVNKPGQTAGEIVKEMVAETVVALNQASNFVNTAAKL
jgi:hypothetical protein